MPLRAWIALAILLMADLVMMVDREMLVLQTQGIKSALELSDLQFGMLQGLGVAIFAATVGYPVGWLADRFDRRLVLFGAILIWALAVVASAYAPNFAALFIVGAVASAGLTGLTPVAFAMIPEMFTAPAPRQLANSIFVVATNMGRGIVIGYCGFVIAGVDAMRALLPAGLTHLDGWRLTFLAAALPAPILLAAVWLLPRTGRGAAHADDQSGSPPSITMGEHIRRNRTAFGLFFGACIVSSLAIAPAAVWLPVAIMRQFGTAPAATGAAFGTASIIGAGLGVAFASVVLPKLQARFGADLPMGVVSISCLIAVACALAMAAARSPLQIYLIFGFQIASMMTSQVLLPTVLQDFAPAELRGRFVSLLGVVGVIGIAIGPPLVGWISDLFGNRPEGLMHSIVSMAGVGMLISAALFWAARKPYARAVAMAQGTFDQGGFHAGAA